VEHFSEKRIPGMVLPLLHAYKCVNMNIWKKQTFISISDFCPVFLYLFGRLSKEDQLTFYTS